MSDKTIRVQDDLYKFVNQEWIDQAEIPADRPTAGGFSELNDQVEKLLISDFNKMASGELEAPDFNVGKAIRLYTLAKDVKKRNRDGIRPVLKTLKVIDGLANISAFNRNLTKLISGNITLPFSLGVEVNMMDTRHHALMLAGPNVILPDTTYYKEGMEAQKNALLGVWSNMAAQILSRTDLTHEEQAQYVQDALAFDAIIATLVKSSEEWSDYPACFNPMKLSRVCSLLKPVNLKKVLTDFYGDNLPEEIVVAEPRFLKGFKTLFNEENFVLYKHWAYVKELVGSCSLLSEELRELGSTYTKMLSGITSLPSIEKQAYRLASGMYSEPVGLYYGRKYFGEEAKKDVVEMVEEIIETYKKRVAANDFLSPETKQKAILKLDKIVIKMGYPDKSDDIFDRLVFDDAGTLYDAIATLNAIKTKDNFSKLYDDVNRERWPMPGHMVNACYSPYTNDITFPAAILQAPFYSIKQSRSENLGGIGAVIGHEISHAFDNNGAKCDENGNLKNWWTKEDEKKFKQKTKAMIREFEGIELEWGKVNATFIVSENIADNGGMAVTLQIMSGMSDADYEGYFYNWARVWCMKARPEYLKLLLSVDVHAPSYLRANMQPRNFDEWYKTFNVTNKDKMYLAPTKRVVIW